MGLRAPFLVEARLDTGLLLQSIELAPEQVEDAILELVGATMVTSVVAMDRETGEVLVQVDKGPKSRLTWYFAAPRRHRLWVHRHG